MRERSPVLRSFLLLLRPPCRVRQARHPRVISFAGSNDEGPEMQRVCGGWRIKLAAMIVAASVVPVLFAQADFPFRDTKLSDNQRIADLLGRLTLEEKINLMSDHPKIPRLGIVFSGQVEGLQEIGRAHV